MSTIKVWLLERFYPAAAKMEIARLRQQIAEKDAEIASLRSYVNGTTDAMRTMRRIVINNGVAK